MEKQTVAKFNGKYYLYWGENLVNLAVSDNLIDWYPNIDEKGNLRKVIAPRDGLFRQRTGPSAGPPALLTDKGIFIAI